MVLNPFKVQIFFEGHKILKKKYLLFDFTKYVNQIYVWKFIQILRHSQNTYLNFAFFVKFIPFDHKTKKSAVIFKQNADFSYQN